jgi:PEP-CTERM motif
MRKLLLATTALIAFVGAANATVVLDTSGSGTGDNVVFDSSTGTLALAHLNDPNSHNEIVHFTDLAGAAFSAGATNGNDVKISAATDIGVTVFASDGTTLDGTTEQVFSIKGSGAITLIVTSVDANGTVEAASPFTFANNALGNGQNFFTLTTLDGEVMTGLEIKDVGGTISDFEHYRLDVAAIPTVAAVPEPSTWAMMILGFCGIVVMGARARRKEGHAFRLV